MNHLSHFLSDRPSRAIGLVFFGNSFLFGNWITRIPDVKNALGLSEMDLGLALLGAPLGALTVMPVAGWVISRLEPGRTAIWFGVLHALSLYFLGLPGDFWMLLCALYFFGITNGIMDIAMNSSASIHEGATPYPIMSTCHGLWSIGAMLGSGLGSVAAGAQLAVDQHLLVVFVVTTLLLVLVSRPLSSLTEAGASAKKKFALPTGLLLLFAIMAFCVMVCEGAIADWSSVYMAEVIESDPYLVGIAYSGFALCMTIGRLWGDAIIPVLGRKRVLQVGGVIAVLGLAVALFQQHAWLVIAGFSISGIGYSCIVPVLFSAAASTPGYTAGSAIAAVTTIGYTGFLIGPPFIGFLAEWFGLANALLVLILCSLMVTVLALVGKFK
ncbi:MFS transporter [Marinoscillum furvescens]|uniref:Fucose permease n=1 Tax=Marinoscillum furvescens DSM 4134 TaxID=1122208 RepID=A0A3D9L7W4_MARFU|nr:MFS transporter [Marinoscillum furvescens]REE01603.1 fucose permease [Marinoscillum furvescens DSM 4134]